MGVVIAFVVIIGFALFFTVFLLAPLLVLAVFCILYLLSDRMGSRINGGPRQAANGPAASTPRMREPLHDAVGPPPGPIYAAPTATEAAEGAETVPRVTTPRTARRDG